MQKNPTPNFTYVPSENDQQKFWKTRFPIEFCEMFEMFEMFGTTLQLKWANIGLSSDIN